MSDATEPYRRQRVAEINAEPGSREALEAQHGQVWNTEELGQDFEVIGFMAPLVVVRRKSDGTRILSLMRLSAPMSPGNKSSRQAVSQGGLKTTILPRAIEL